MRCWRTADFQLVRDFLNPERDEFYDLVNDPGETKNLIRTTTEKLHAVFEKYDFLIQASDVGDKLA